MGIPVVHLLPGEKVSHAKIGAATLDLNTIYSRAKANNFNAGAYAYTDGDLSLFDVDGDAAKKRIEEETGHDLDSIDTFTVATPNGGWHFYFVKDAELGALGNVEVSYGTHIGFELRQNNQYVVAPYSVLPDGRTWTILKARPVGEMPPWLREWIQKQKKAPKTAAKTSPATESTDIERQEQFENWLTANHVEFEPATWDAKESRLEYILTTRCPWEHAHGEKNDDKDFVVYLYDDGHFGAHCVHTSCKNEWPLPNESAWKNFRAFLESKNGHITMYPSGQVTVGAQTESLIESPGSKVVPVSYESWRKLFVDGSQMSSVPYKFLIDRFLTEDSSMFFAALPGHGKTLAALSMARAFIYKKKLFGTFDVLEQLPVLYLIPESGEKSFKQRMVAFELDDPKRWSDPKKFPDKDMFLCRTMTQGKMLELTDPALLAAVKGRVIFLDTAIRFGNSTNENDATANKYLSEAIFSLLYHGARAVIGVHHSPKSAEKAAVMTLENMLRGSGDIGAMLDVAWGIRQLNRSKMMIHVECLKPRDFVPAPPFVLEGRPYIDETHDFKYAGLARPLSESVPAEKKAVDTSSPNYKAACILFAAGKSQNFVSKELGIHKTTASNYHDRWEQDQTKEENQ